MAEITARTPYADQLADLGKELERLDEETALALLEDMFDHVRATAAENEIAGKPDIPLKDVTPGFGGDNADVARCMQGYDLLEELGIHRLTDERRQLLSDALDDLAAGEMVRSIETSKID